MSFGLPALNSKSFNPPHTSYREGPYGVPDAMVSGISKHSDKEGTLHQMQAAIGNGSKFEHQLNMNIMRGIQGIHAPLRVAMELQCFKNVGRLPFLPSSNLSTDVLLGKDDYIDFNDILYPPDVHEKLAQPHAVMEKHLGIL